MRYQVRGYSQWVRNISSPSERSGEVYSSVLGGYNNIISADYASIIGGANNIVGAGGTCSSIVGGRYNTIAGFNSCYSAILGGHNNTIGAGFHNSFIIGSNVNAVANHTTHVEGLNACATPAFVPATFPIGTVMHVVAPAILGFPAGTCMLLIQ